MIADHIASTPTLALNMPQWTVALLVVGFLFVSVVMILVVLIQRPQGGGLSGAFGAGGGSAGQTAFGARTGDALTISTITIFVLYLLVAIALNWVIVPPTVEQTNATVTSDNPPQSQVDESTSIPAPAPADAEQTPADASPQPDADTTQGPAPEPTPAQDQGDQPEDGASGG
ncbi:MAG: preprotein translocase subunit SecG [Phycisphaeraceae bacterium]|nr:preprotein translocase subunit SecG [Phycisphaeraceae bacterium]MCB9848875.1 preprotein translocase subunit SecG [Phycisphaeraceae bacterium]